MSLHWTVFEGRIKVASFKGLVERLIALAQRNSSLHVYRKIAVVSLFESMLNAVVKFMYLISNFRLVLNVVCFLLGNSLASAYKIQTPRNCPEESVRHLHTCLFPLPPLDSVINFVHVYLFKSIIAVLLIILGLQMSKGKYELYCKLITLHAWFRAS